jgi:predicted transport protein
MARMSPQQMQEAVIRGLPEKTGKSLEEWVAVVGTTGLTGFKERVDWLKREHGLGDIQAEMVVYGADNSGPLIPEDTTKLLDAQYEGRKAPLRPILDAIEEEALLLGPDVKAEVRTTYVSFVRRRSFAIVQPSAATRVDLGLVLHDAPESDRLLPAGSFGSGRINYRVPLENLDDVDGEVLGWLRMAYEQDGA